MALPLTRLNTQLYIGGVFMRLPFILNGSSVFAPRLLLFAGIKIRRLNTYKGLKTSTISFKKQCASILQHL
jgi:hypothetical protein